MSMSKQSRLGTLALLLCVIALCLAAPSATAGKSPSPSLITTSMTLQLCPGTPPGSLSASASEASFQLPSDLADVATSLEAWGYSNNNYPSPPATLLAPGSFSCAAFYASADGGLNMFLAGPDDACYSVPERDCFPNDVGSYERSISAADRISAVFGAGGAVSPLYIACPYFPSAQAALARLQALRPEMSDCDQLPADETVQQLAPEAVAFYEPPEGSGATTNPTFGVVLRLGFGATCTMPVNESAVCETVLAAFLTGWGPVYSLSANEATTAAAALDTLPWFASS
jgi:hypothetical protein